MFMKLKNLIIFVLGFAVGYGVCFVTKTDEGRELREERREKRQEKAKEMKADLKKKLKEKLDK